MRVVIFSLGLLVLAASVLAYPTGAPNGYAGQPPTGANCVSCHGSYPVNSGDGVLQIGGLPSGGYVPGTAYTITVTQSDPGQSRWGFELTAIYQSGTSYLQAGDLAVTDPTHTVLGVGSGTAPDYMKQNSAGTYAGTPGPTSWSFSWTAPTPAVGTIGFYASGMGANNTGGTGGDYCYTTSAMVSPAGGTPNVVLDLVYVSGSPVAPGGGPLTYSVTLTNNQATPLNFDYWCTYTQGATTVAAFGPINRTSPAGPGYNINRSLTQTVPGSLGAGAWNYNGMVGSYPTVWATDFFPFTKSAVGDGGAYYAESKLTGWEDDEVVLNSATPMNFELKGNYPNPFNPTTAISYQLSANSLVHLRVYDAAGNLVGTLVNGWRDAGTHEVSFDGSNLASGVYVYLLNAGDFTASGKMVLMK